MKLTTANYKEVCDKKVDLVILPWGATEPHNFHLPYLTDCLLSEAVALDAANNVLKKQNYRCAVLPAISMGAQNPGQRDLPLCIHTSYSTQYSIFKDIVNSLNHQGFRKLVLINGHGGNSFKPMVRDLAVEYPDFVIVVADWFTIIPPKGYFENVDDHAGEVETSVMMHYYPNLVDLSICGTGESTRFNIESLNDKTAWTPRNWLKTTKDTGIGDPRKSTAEKGRVYAEKVVEKLETLFVEMIEKELY